MHTEYYLISMRDLRKSKLEIDRCSTYNRRSEIYAKVDGHSTFRLRDFRQRERETLKLCESPKRSYESDLGQP